MNHNDTILVVEDEAAIAESVQYALGKAGFRASVALDLASARRLHAEKALIVLDLMLPDGNGRELIEELRLAGRRTPIIVLSSRDSEEDRVNALEAGADDYVTKPFSPREVVARVRAVLRRLGSADGRQTSHAPLQLDRETREARIDGEVLELTRVEFDLLAELATQPGKVFARSELIDRVWGSGFAITDRTVDSHIKSLRRKISTKGTSSSVIQTVRGVGYRIGMHPG